MIQKRMDRDGLVERTTELASELAAAETMRSAADAAHHRDEEHKKEEEKVSVFWRVFGGTILSIVALAAVTLYNSLSGSISELRTELNKERECRAELVRKDEFNTRITNQYERIRAAEGMQNALTALKGEHDAVKEKLAAAATCLDAVRKDAAGLDPLRERVAALEAVKKELAGLDILKERVTANAADLKAAKEEFAKLHQEVTQNRASDLERKAFRDTQTKAFDETLKELNTRMQECREKLARLEAVQQAPAAPAPKPPAAPVSPASFQKPMEPPSDY